MFAVFAFNGIGVATWVGRVPSFRDDLQLSAPELGLLLMGVSGGSVLGLLLSSHVLAWLGARRTIVWTMTACAVGLVIIGVGAETLTSFAVTFAGLALYGVGTAMCDIAINLEGAEVERERGKTIMPLFHAVWSMGSVLGAGAAAIAALATVPLPVHTTVMAVVILAGVLVSVRFLPAIDPEQEDARPSQSLTDRLRAWLEPRTLLIGVIALGMALAEGSAGDWLAVGLVDDRRVTNAAGTAFFAVFTAAMMVGRGVGSPLIDRFGRIPLLRVSELCGVAGLALVIFVDSPLAYAPGIVLWGLGAALGFPVRARRFTSRSRARPSCPRRAAPARRARSACRRRIRRGSISSASGCRRSRRAMR